ncbi:hypothetical protein CEXT_158181 [Caerostris extrusa]|uniref:Uncharacterized protein n=1 Tax=Caerostris extrusa TaxID=172846 RepID=A0AAV4XE06_CAEEX|nr:hypothetical protein CEXT_158181 [Caerostris extrusa]
MDSVVPGCERREGEGVIKGRNGWLHKGGLRTEGLEWRGNQLRVWAVLSPFTEAGKEWHDKGKKSGEYLLCPRILRLNQQEFNTLPSPLEDSFLQYQESLSTAPLMTRLLVTQSLDGHSNGHSYACNAILINTRRTFRGQATR